MSQSSYNNIRKYAAFIFMVFTVLSGSSEGFDSDSYIKAGKKAFIDILASNKLFIQGEKVSVHQSAIRNSEQDNDSFREFVAANSENTSLNNIKTNAFPLTLQVYCLNNIILKNNIWKNALF